MRDIRNDQDVPGVESVAKLVLEAIEHPGGAIETIISVETWKDPATWGLFMADLARHIGNAYEQAYDEPAGRTVTRLLEIFHAELERPTDQTRGHLHRASPHSN